MVPAETVLEGRSRFQVLSSRLSGSIRQRIRPGPLFISGFAGLAGRLNCGSLFQFSVFQRRCRVLIMTIPRSHRSAARLQAGRFLAAAAAVSFAHATQNSFEPAPQEPGPHHASAAGDSRFETYRQEVTVTFASERDAERAVLRLTALWDDREWAVSSRWDDLNPNNLRMRDVMTRHGHRGTFYLNSWFQNWSEMPESPNYQEARALLQGGHSLGGHSMSHPWLSYCHRNRMFEETAGVRMIWEAATDSPVISYAFSYSNFRNEEEGDSVQHDIIRSLERAGFYHVANEPSFGALGSHLILSPILPADGAPIRATAETRLADPGFKAAHPILTYAMHALYQAPSEWARFEQSLNDYGLRPDWWYCNQNEYAAYRYQYEHAKLQWEIPKADESGAWARTRRLILDRPVLLDLNVRVPLTLRIDGVGSDSVTEIRCSTADLVPKGATNGAFRLDLHHDRDQRLPVRIGMVPPNLLNRSALTLKDTDGDLPGIHALLFSEGSSLNLVLENRSPYPVTQCRVTYRLPLAWGDGVTYRHLDELAAASRVVDRWTPSQVDRDHKTSAGAAFLVAQVDARWNGMAVRLYASCHVSLSSEDSSYPQGAFLRLGPVPVEQLDHEQLRMDIASGAARLQPWQVDDGSVLQWDSQDGAWMSPYFDPERIRLTGGWTGWNLQGFFAIRSLIHSNQKQMARLQRTADFVTRVILNDVDVTLDDQVQLMEGANTLTMVCASFPCVFVRLSDVRTGERLRNIRYDLPRIESETSLPYLVAPRPDTEPMDLWPSRLADGRMLIRWSNLGILQSAPSPAGPWADTSSAWRSIVVEVNEPTRFFRLRSR